MNFKLLGMCIAALEWYDVLLAISLADIVSQNFFPALSKINSYILYLASITISYISRPFGAFLFGYYSDKYNRIKASYYSFLLISITTIFIAILPTYKNIGVLAPIFLIILRFIQAFALAGNNNLWIISIENEPRKKYFASSLLSIGFILGSLTSSFVVIILYKFFTKDMIIDFAWRIPYFIGLIFAIFILVGYYKLDKKLLEKKNNIQNTKINIKHIIKIFIKTFTLLFSEIILFYLFFVFFTNYKIIFLNQDPFDNWVQYIIGMAAMLIATPIFGKLADKYGCISLLRLSSIAIFIFWVFATYFNQIHMLYVSVVFGILQAVTFGSLYGYIPSIFPKSIRSRVSSIIISLASAVCASIVPLLCAKLAYYDIKYVFWIFSLIFFLKIILLYSFKKDIVK